MGNEPFVIAMENVACLLQPKKYDRRIKTKLFSVVLCIMLVFCFPIAANSEDKNDPEAEAVMLEIMQFLEGDTQAQLLFAAEMDLSNGVRGADGYGERRMFGRLVYARHVLEDYEEYAPHVDEIWAEAKRLLFGPWKNDGRTVFTFVTRKNVRMLDFSTGEWIYVDEIECVEATHYTEMSGKEKSTCFDLLTGQTVRI